MSQRSLTPVSKHTRRSYGVWSDQPWSSVGILPTKLSGKPKYGLVSALGVKGL